MKPSRRVAGTLLADSPSPSALYWRATATLFISISYLPLQFHVFRSRLLPSNPWLDGWVRWDSMWYRDIALRGYFFTPGEESSVAFFPVYPLLIRALTQIMGAPSRAGVLI